MSTNDPWKWNEEKIWESILDPNRIKHHEYDSDLFEWWEDKYNINKEEYHEMYDSQYAMVRNDWDDLDLNEFSIEHIKELEIILKRPNIHPMQEKVAKILRDRLKARINDEKYGAAGWMVTGKAIGNGDIDPENLK